MGVKQRLVYCYFKTMDELIVETFRRLVAREFARLRKAVSSERPLRELWYICIHTADARLISEFMALTHRIQALRSEVVAFIEDSRRMQLNALSAVLERTAKQSSLPAEAIAIMATGVSLLLTREAAQGEQRVDPVLAALADADQDSGGEGDRAAAGIFDDAKPDVRVLVGTAEVGAAGLVEDRS